MSEPQNGEITSLSEVRLRLGPTDARYGRGLVAGAKVMELFGDLETEIAIRDGGDEGLCVAYDSVEFLRPLFVGDFVHAKAVARRGRSTSRRVELELYRTIAATGEGLAKVSDPPELIARAEATIVVGAAAKVAAAHQGTSGS